MKKRSPEKREKPPILNFDRVLDQWVDQEGDRYAPVLIERGFLLPEEARDPARVRAVTREWRAGMAEMVESHEWHPERITDLTSILQWRLGGYRGWSLYRPEDALFTTFADVVARIDDTGKEVPQDHRTRFPEMAANIKSIATSGIIFALRCGSDVAVLEGTHRTTALAYALAHNLPVPQELTIYITDLPEKSRAAFDAFCRDIPRRYGPYYHQKP